MRIVVAIFLLFIVAAAQAHEVSGKVEVLLKGDKRKSDLSTVVVYLDQMQPTSKISGIASNKSFVISTRNKQFSPRIIAVPVKATVQFPNYDSIFHNLFSVSSPNDFDLGFFKGGANKSKTFEYPGIVRVFCNVHPQMSASIIVTTTSYYTVADQDGNFSLGIVPSGAFNLRAFAEEGQVARRIDVSGVPLKINLEIDGRAFKKVPHKNKLGQDYATDDERY